MAFYTNLYRYTNNIFYRGYSDNGDRVIKKEHYKPRFYVTSNTKTNFKSLDGQYVGPVEFNSMYEAGQWFKDNVEVSGRSIYGNKRFVTQYAMDKFPQDIQFDRNMINVGTFDIETDYDDGFPYPDQAAHAILSISYKSSKFSTYHVWGYGDFDVKASLIKDVKYVRCNSEEELLTKFIEFCSHPDIVPDVITGWNTRFFDIPYIINRVAKVLGIEWLSKFSPYGVQIPPPRMVPSRGKENMVYEIPGIQTLDYMELFQKFGYTYGPQESYALNHIAYVVLGERKLSFEESGSLKNLYKDDFQKYIDYNMKDVQLVDRLEEKMGLITLAMTMAYKGGVNYTDTFGTTSIWDSIIYRKLNSERKVPPVESTMQCKSKQFAGGYVKAPQTGMHDWVVSFDLNSLYPNIIVQWNMSTETLIDQSFPNGIEYYLENYDKVNSDDIVAANGSTYSRKNIGVIPDLIVQYYADRRSIKDMMLSAQQEYQKEKTYELEKEINTLENQQMAIKILMNSLYGALGNQYFKYFDLRLAEGVTLSGQLAIKWAERAVNEYMNELLKTEDVDYVIAIDTDSLYVNFGPMVEKFEPKNPVNFLDGICRTHVEPKIKEAYDRLFEKMNCFKPRMEMAREVMADRGIWAAKKRYILNVHNSEGVQYKEPKLKIMGIEAIKSSTPEVCRDKFQEIFKIMMNSTESEVQKFIQEFKNEFYSLAPELVAFPRSVSLFQTVVINGKSEKIPYADKKTIYRKGCPIHVRGALLYNKLL